MSQSIYIVFLTEGDYEDRTSMPLWAYPTRRLAADDVDCLNALSREFQSKVGDLRDTEPRLQETEEYDREYEAFDKKRDALTTRWRKKMGVPVLNHYDRPEFSFTRVLLRNAASTKIDKA